VIDRLEQIRERLEVVRVWPLQRSTTADALLINRLANDVGWLIDEVARLKARVRMYEEVKS
jgi:hypothetical protein